MSAAPEVPNAPASPAAAPKAASAPAERKPRGPALGRRLAREFALQGLYRWLLNAGEGSAAEADVRELDGFAQPERDREAFERCDRAHFDALLHGCIEQAAALDVVLTRHVDRKTTMLSPVEHGILMIGVYELMHCVDIPYRVVINEGVELAKSFGGTDGHKYVNGVLDKCAAELRPAEARGARR